MTQLDLLTYPFRAGWKARETSKAAADSINVTLGQQAVLTALRHHGPMTADECAEKMGNDRLYVRPRCSELATKGLVKDTGTTRKNASGKSAVVWVAV